MAMGRKGTPFIFCDLITAVPVDKRALPFSSRIREMEEAGILEPVTGKGPRRLPPPIPVENGMAERLLEKDRERLP
jgi:hypothetical protein